MNEFVKKTQKTPKEEIQIAKDRLGRGLNKGIDYDRESGKFEFSGKEYIQILLFLNYHYALK